VLSNRATQIEDISAVEKFTLVLLNVDVCTLSARMAAIARKMRAQAFFDRADRAALAASVRLRDVAWCESTKPRKNKQ